MIICTTAECIGPLLRQWFTQVSVSSTTTSSDAALVDSKRVAVPVESAVLNSVDDTLKNDAQKAAERVNDASHGPSLATASVQTSGGPTYAPLHWTCQCLSSLSKDSKTPP